MPPDMLKTLIELGSFGVLVYVLIHLLTRVIPQMERLFRDSLEKITADAAAQRRTFQEECEQARKYFARQMETLIRNSQK
jgi:hypothetical protein